MTKIVVSDIHPALASASAFSYHALARLARAELTGLPDLNCDMTSCTQSGPSDFDLNPGLIPPLSNCNAAVLVPIVARDTLTVLLTRRSAHLTQHAGQIAFPGGRIDPADGGAAAAALREAHEEVGIIPSDVSPLGFLEPYRTATGFTIFPLVGLIDPRFTLVLQHSEVAEAFEVPLAFLMDSTNHAQHIRSWQGIDRRYYAMTWDRHYIWGATAGMLKNLQQRLFHP